MATVSQGIVRRDGPQAALPEKKNVPAVVSNSDDYRQRYINDIAKEFGKPLKFSKDGVWITDKDAVDENRRFISR
jgi:hypothetical protein